MRDRWVAVVPLRGVTDRQKFRELLTPWGEQQVSYLDLKEESNRMVSLYRNETLRLLGWGVLSIGLVLLVGLRAPVTVLRVMLPIGSAIVVVAALLHALGERFSLFHYSVLSAGRRPRVGLCLVLQPETWDPGGARTHRLWPGRMQHDHDLGIRSAGPLADSRAPSHRNDHGVGIAGLSGLCRVTR